MSLKQERIQIPVRGADGQVIVQVLGAGRPASPCCRAAAGRLEVVPGAPAPGTHGFRSEVHAGLLVSVCFSVTSLSTWPVSPGCQAQRRHPRHSQASRPLAGNFSSLPQVLSANEPPVAAVTEATASVPPPYGFVSSSFWRSDSNQGPLGCHWGPPAAFPRRPRCLPPPAAVSPTLLGSRSHAPPWSPQCHSQPLPRSPHSGHRSAVFRAPARSQRPAAPREGLRDAARSLGAGRSREGVRGRGQPCSSSRERCSPREGAGAAGSHHCPLGGMSAAAAK